MVNDPDAALAFYRDTLGLELRNDVAREDFRWITVGAASQPGISIVLTNYIQGSPADLDTVFAAVRDAGGEVVQEPTTQPWGVRDCAFRDPSGNLVRVNQA